MPSRQANIKNEKLYEGLTKRGMSKPRAAKIATSPGASQRGGQKARAAGRRRSTAKQGGMSTQKRAAGRKGGRSSARARKRG